MGTWLLLLEGEHPFWSTRALDAYSRPHRSPGAAETNHRRGRSSQPHLLIGASPLKDACEAAFPWILTEFIQLIH